jgi:hypothetical protein
MKTTILAIWLAVCGAGRNLSAQSVPAAVPEEVRKQIRHKLDSSFVVFRDTVQGEAHEALAAVLARTLSDGQRARLRQIELQRDQSFEGDTWQELQVTEEQRDRFMALIQETQGTIKALMGDAQKGNLDETRTRVLKTRADLVSRLEALLTEAQKTRWKEILGKLMAPDEIFDR